MHEELFSQQIDAMRRQMTQSQQLLGSAPTLYREVLTDAFSQIDTTLEELQIADEELRLQSEALLHSSEAIERERRKYRELFEFAPSGYLITNADGLILEANEAAAILLGVSARYLARKPLVNFLSPGDKPCFRSELLSLRHMPYIPDWELTIHPRNGQPFVVSATVSAARDERGTVSAIRWVLKDITERKRAEQKIRDLNEQLEAKIAARTAALEASVRRERHVTQTLVRRMIQDLPDRAFPGIEVRTLYTAAAHDLQVGGDFFDTFALDDGSVVFVVGDVSGKGLAAASHTAEVKYSLRAYLRTARDPQEALASVNDYLCSAQSEYAAEEESIFVVLSIAIVRAADNSITMCAAGSEPPILMRADETIEAATCRGLPLGIVPDGSYAWIESPFAAGDRLLLVTDGITEARRQREMLGIDGLTGLAAATRHLPLVESGRAILDGARAFAGGQLQDDACLLIAERIDSDQRTAL